MMLTKQLARRLGTAALCCTLLSSHIAAQVSSTNVGTTAASFLEVGVGAAAIGMGGAYVAMAGDISGLYWNPGGISRVKQTQALFEYLVH